MAEAFARKIARAPRNRRSRHCSSAGTNAWDNSRRPTKRSSSAWSAEIDLTGHRARKLTPAIVSEADLIFVMTPGHLEQVKQLGGRGKVHVIDEYASGTANQGSHRIPTAAISTPTGTRPTCSRRNSRSCSIALHS